MNNGIKIAASAFGEGARQCETEEELDCYLQTLLSLACRGMGDFKGQKFKKKLLRWAIQDRETISMKPFINKEVH